MEKLLSSLAMLEAKTDAAEQRIKGAAAQRLKMVDARLATIRHDAITNDKAAEEYLSLIAERGRLHQLLALQK